MQMMNLHARDMTSQPDQPSFVAAGAILTIGLGAIRANYRQLRDRLGGAYCAGVVKADAYGLGAVEVSRALREAGCGVFFVAHLTEGLELREALGADVEIYVLNGLPEGAENLAVQAGLTVVCNSLGQLHAWRRAARESAMRLPVAVQVDSGMSRLGMSAAEVEAVAADAAAFDGLELRLVMSISPAPTKPTTRPTNSSAATSRRCVAGCRKRPRRLPIRRASSSATNSATTWRGRAPRSTASTRRRGSRTRCGKSCAWRRR
jgi:alanine racemase